MMKELFYAIDPYFWHLVGIWILINMVLEPWLDSSINNRNYKRWNWRYWAFWILAFVMVTILGMLSILIVGAINQW